MTVQISSVSKFRAQLGESPVWDDRQMCLWWVDIESGLLLRFDPESRTETQYDWGEKIGSVALRDKEGLLLATASGFWTFNPDTHERRHICDPEPDSPRNRFNDGATDSAGRFWAGSMSEDLEPVGSIYCLETDYSVKRTMSGLRTPNGLAFSKNGKRMYWSDSFPSIRKIWTCNYDPATTERSHIRTFFDTRAVAGRPDGGTVDAEGFYWQAGVSGWQLYRISPDGSLVQTIDMPVARPSKAVFGGKNLDVLYVTSIGMGTEDDPTQPDAGRLFQITGLGVTGTPPWRFLG